VVPPVYREERPLPYTGRGLTPPVYRERTNPTLIQGGSNPTCIQGGSDWLHIRDLLFKQLFQSLSKFVALASIDMNHICYPSESSKSRR
jgi:hypothetical protein